MTLDQGRQYPYIDHDLISNQTFGGLASIEIYLGRSLSEGLTKAGIKRALEVGVGWNFTNMKQLARLTRGSTQVFAPDNLLAIDESLLPDSRLLGSLGTYGDRFRRERIAVEKLNEKVKRGTTPPFDLVISTGIASIGWIAPQDAAEAQREIGKTLKIIEAMKNCLNRSNPRALLLMESQLLDEALFFSRTHLTNLGLEIVYSEQSNRHEWKKILQEWGIFPSQPEHSGYRLVLCRQQ